MIIVLANDFAPEIGGIQRYMSELCSALSRAGQPILAIAPAGAGSKDVDAELPYTVRRFATGSRLLRLFGMTLSLWRALAKYPLAKIIASSWFPAAAIAVCFPRRLRGTVLVLVHGKEIARSVSLREPLMRWVFRRADRVCANSSFTRDAFQRRFPFTPIDVVGCGVDYDDSPRAPLRSQRVLSVGRLVERKGFDTVLRALAPVLQQHPDVRYRLVGSGPDESRLRALAGELRISSSVDFLGAVDDKSLKAEYERATCFAMPCRSIGEDIEGFGLVFLEASRYGVPSIVGRECGAAEAIGDVGIVVDGDDVLGVSQAISELIADRESSARLGALARERVLNEFGWPAVADRILKSL